MDRGAQLQVLPRGHKGEQYTGYTCLTEVSQETSMVRKHPDG
ncbi:hypothetical protein PoMZ_09893 [Pyricularia oryzae]|uniref:Uncharacterized protein n=1 Tax=Pyricularia oryzae TaxID=318829 RepID=A0A4P7MVX5_PYROR|nr:hypothetical protein PoMZ_09893 [Pyricularia oryzae]